jgi:ABC-type transport system involved in multi-copper enzyme maturation permease subunit
MPFLPLVNGHLHAASRRPATYWLRSVVAATALLVGCFVYYQDQGCAPDEIAKDLLIGLLFLCLIYCMTLGLVSTADCVSMEKREGTLGLLFLTDLKGWDIVAGKFTAASLGGFDGLLATVPILALTLWFGGVSGGDVGREVLLVLVTFFFQVALGIFVSVLSRRQFRALLAAVAGLLLFNLVLPATAALLLYLTPSHRSPLAACLFLPSPLVTVIMSLLPVPIPELQHFWWSLATIHALTWLFLFLASLILPLCWRDKPAEGWKARWHLFCQRWSYGRPGQRARLCARLLHLNPFCWLTARSPYKPAYVWSCLALLAGLWIWGSARFGADWFHNGVYFPTALLLGSMLKFWVAAEAGRQLYEDRRAGALELLLTTPSGVKDILRGNLLALRRQFLGPFLVVVTAEFIFLAASLQRESFRANPVAPALWLAVILFLAADLIAITWAGLWAALTVEPPNHPPGVTILRLLVAPAVLFYVLLGVISLMLGPRSVHHLTWRFYLGLWVPVGLAFDVAYGLAAWWQLRTNFRRLAVERPAPILSQLARWFLPARPQ